MNQLPKDTFPDNVSQTLNFMKGQPFQYLAMIATHGENYYQAIRITPKTHGQAKTWIAKLREMADELEQQVEHQMKEDK